MQQYVTATVFSATLIVSALAAAAEPVPQTQVEYNQQPQQVYYYQQPAPQAQQQQYYSAQPAQQQQPTFFGRMMDLERRKNNAILRFFGLR
jgi:hypothetical protein